MKTMGKKLISALCALTLLAALLPASVAAGPTVGGWFESIYAELPGVADSQVTAVAYTGPVSGSLTGEDLEYLVRDTGKGSVRIDIPGLKAGVYTLTVTANGREIKGENIRVAEYDRSGFAHYQYTEGVGAYNDDGTLKANAKVLYVTDANKDTVKLTAGGVTVTGIGKILDRKSGILNKLAKANTPLVIRFVGDVKAPKGVSEKKMSTDAEKQNGDNGSMTNIGNTRHITLEGVGADAVINGWGFSFVSQSGDSAQGMGKSFEARNLTFRNVPEDCLNFEGVQDDKTKTLTSPIEHCWVHNCSFYVPHIANPAAVDKAEGDGALDFKRGQYFTMSYCYFEGYHKTNLVGGGDSNLQYHITWHHNYWNKCQSRGPLGRQANMHIYNCLIEGQTGYAMNTRANCYIFSEYNTFLNSKNPMRVESKDSGYGRGGPIKSWGDKFTNCSGDRQGTMVKEKTQKVDSKNRYANFDTDPSLSYIPSGSYRLDESTDKAVEKVKAWAGVMKAPSAVTWPDGETASPQVSTGSAEAVPTPTPAPTPAPVVKLPADVQESDWFCPAVKHVLAKGAMKGTNLGFEPHTELTVASIYQTLYNMEGSPAVEAGESSRFEFLPGDVDLGTSEDRAAIPAGTVYAGRFKVMGKVVQRWHDGKNAVFCVEADKDEKGALEFTVTGRADVTVLASSTGSSNSSAVGLIEVVSGGVLPNAEGIATVTGTQAASLTYTGLPAGTYRVVSTATDDENLNRGVRIHGVTMEEKTAPSAGAWYSAAVNWAAAQGLYAGSPAAFADGKALRGDVKNIMDLYCAQKGITAVLFKGDASGNLMLDKSLERCEWAQVLTNLDGAQ